MKDLILIEGNEKYQFDTLEELIETIIHNKYYEMSENVKKEQLELKAFANCMQENVDIVSKGEKLTSIDGKFIIQDEITYVLSLLLLNKVMLLERTNSNIFTKNLDKSNISDNYIIVNHYAEDLLKKYLENMVI